MQDVDILYIYNCAINALEITASFFEQMEGGQVLVRGVRSDCCSMTTCVYSSVRALGTAAVDMCQVATGGADAYYHIGMHCWDIAASAIIVQEAGGVVMDTDGLSMSGYVIPLMHLWWARPPLIALCVLRFQL